MLSLNLQQFQMVILMMPFVFAALEEFICSLMRMILRSTIVAEAYELVCTYQPLPNHCHLLLLVTQVS